MQIHTGEIYGKQTANKFVMYNVLKVKKRKIQSENVITLQNIDNPRSLFEATQQKLSKSGYIRVSQTPYIDTTKQKTKNTKTTPKQKPNRCPRTLDFIELRSDSERPAPIIQDMFS